MKNFYDYNTDYKKHKYTYHGLYPLEVDVCFSGDNIPIQCACGNKSSIFSLEITNGLKIWKCGECGKVYARHSQIKRNNAFLKYRTE